LKNGEGVIDMDSSLLELTELQQVLREYAKDAREIYKYQISLGGKNASRKLTDTIKSNVVVGEQEYEVTLTLEHYWKYVEFGRQGKDSSPLKAYPGAYPPGKAAFPPVKAILDWISVKPILPRPDDEGNMQRLRPKSLAFLIGRKIQQHGIEPHPALHRTIEELDKIYHEKLSAALGHDVSNYIRKIIAVK
jgi:hypothetical protein